MPPRPRSGRDRPAAPPCPPQLCKDSAFCTRLRGNSTDAFAVDPSSVRVVGGRVHATITNRLEPGAAFELVLTTYGDTLRLHINEAGAPGEQRFQVPDVLLPGLDDRLQVSLADTSAAGQADRTPSLLPAARPPPSCRLPAQQVWDKWHQDEQRLTATSGAAEVELRFAPVALGVSVGGVPVLHWNKAGQFVFEHARQKQVRARGGWAWVGWGVHRARGYLRHSVGAG